MRQIAIFPALLLLAACDSAPKVAFADASVTLPDEPVALPEGPGREAVLGNCSACHSPSMLMQQPKVPRAKWEAIVAKMRKVYKAPIDDAAAGQVVDYMLAVQARPETMR